jgi:hypothetical protein
LNYGEEIVQLVGDKAGHFVRSLEIVRTRRKVCCRRVLFVPS